MKYAFLTTLIPKQLEDEVRNRSKHNMQDAANALQWHIFEGLCVNIQEPIKIFNVLPIGSFPRYYSRLFVKKMFFCDDAKREHINIGFCNVKLFRKWHQPRKIYAQLKKWCAEDQEDKTLFVYTVSAPFMDAVAKLKKKYPSLKVCAIVADLPDMSSLSSNKGFLKRIFEKIQAKNAYSRIWCVDAFVLLTKQMADYMQIDKPYVVMEGIATCNDLPKSRKNDGLKRILYSGTLHKRFGVLHLVEAFRRLDDPDCRLIICGTGDCEAEIIKACKEDDRIEFKGQLKREAVLQLQYEATVLVNPRQNNEEFTKYSFPSKNLEYLSSGVPLVAYKLDGVSDEYDEYINYVEDDSVKTLCRVLKETCEDADGEVSARALKAMRFVRNEKNARNQTLKIRRMMDAL